MTDERLEAIRSITVQPYQTSVSVVLAKELLDYINDLKREIRETVEKKEINSR